jgi:hypothetical protein
MEIEGREVVTEEEDTEGVQEVTEEGEEEVIDINL